MDTPRSGELFKNFGPLREVVQSLDAARRGVSPSGNERQRLVRKVRAAGSAAVPRLISSLASSSEDEASWAYDLLAYLGGDRVCKALDLVCSSDAPDNVKARALGLLSELSAPMPSTVKLRDPEALLSQSVRELLAGIDHGDELDQAVALIIDHVPDPEVPAFIAELIRHGGHKAAPIVSALLQRGGLSDESAQALRELQRDAGAAPPDRVTQDALDRGA